MTGQMRRLSGMIIVLLAFMVGLLVVSGCSNDAGNMHMSTTYYAVANVTVSGTVTYEDKEYDADGYTGNILTKNARYARVDVVDPGTGKVVDYAITNGSGQYSLTFDSPSSLIYLSAVSVAYMGGQPVAMVNASSYYAVGGANINTVSGDEYTYDIAINESNTYNGAFNILDVLVTGGEFVNSITGSWPPELSRVVWVPGSSKGTYFCDSYDYYYCPYGVGIYILDLIGDDSDTYDDDVIWHEYAHLMGSLYSRDDSPGGAHTFEDPPQDLRLSWSEGWADHFPGALKRWLSQNDPALLSSNTVTPEYYIDSTLNGTYLWINLAEPGDTEPYMYSTNEIAVSKILLDLGAVLGGPSEVWTAFEGLTASTEEVSLGTFWDSWLLNNGVANVPEVRGVLEDRRVFYEEDAYEADELPEPARLAVFNASGAALETHYLYRDDGVADSDIIAFNASIANTYTVDVFCTKNGVDTMVRILNTDGVTVLADNDDRSYTPYYACNDMYTGLSSYIDSFIPPADGTYYVEVISNATGVKTSVDLRSPYGTYNLYIWQE